MFVPPVDIRTPSPFSSEKFSIPSECACFVDKLEKFDDYLVVPVNSSEAVLIASNTKNIKRFECDYLNKTVEIYGRSMLFVGVLPSRTFLSSAIFFWIDDVIEVLRKYVDYYPIVYNYEALGEDEADYVYDTIVPNQEILIGVLVIMLVSCLEVSDYVNESVTIEEIAKGLSVAKDNEYVRFKISDPFSNLLVKKFANPSSSDIISEYDCPPVDDIVERTLDALNYGVVDYPQLLSQSDTISEEDKELLSSKSHIIKFLFSNSITE